MRVEFDKSFYKSLDKVHQRGIDGKVEKLITTVEEAQNLQQVRNLKKMTGYRHYYRIRLGDYHRH